MQSSASRIARSFAMAAMLLAIGCSEESTLTSSERDAEVTPAVDGCTPKECGPRPAAANYVCADGTLAGPGPCERMQDGQCGYPSHACVERDSAVADGGTLDGAVPDADVGPDAASPARCGVRGTADCAPNQFCDVGLDTQCNALGLGGSCQPVPAACDASYDPVCGCDNRSYDNACSAHMLGLSVLHKGLCTADECLAAGGTPTRGIGDAAPVCGPAEPGWPIGRAIEPVLCCVPVPVPGGSCGGIGGRRCGTGLFCNYEAAAGGTTECGLHDGTGVCSLYPTSCSEEYAPVCGCDHRTYATACAAHGASISVLHEGACTERDCAAAGGRPVNGTGAAPSCGKDETEHGAIVYSSGQPSIEGAICCVPL